jgi:DNA-binding response OmpR family regulator
LRLAQRESAAVLVNGDSHLNTPISGMEAGADDLIAKPFTSNILLAKLDQVLRQAGRQ